MNCKPGDMALVIRGFKPNIGKIVTIIRKATDEDILAGFNEPFLISRDWEVWMVDQPMQANHEVVPCKPIVYFQFDQHMIPLNADLEEEDALLYADG